jgi:hypothetical protein
MSIADVKAATDEIKLDGAMRAKVDAIFSASLARGGMTPDERQDLLDIFEVQAGLADIEIASANKVLAAVDEYENDIAAAGESALADLESAAEPEKTA